MDLHFQTIFLKHHQPVFFGSSVNKQIYFPQKKKKKKKGKKKSIPKQLVERHSKNDAGWDLNLDLRKKPDPKDL